MRRTPGWDLASCKMVWEGKGIAHGEVGFTNDDGSGL